MAILLVERCNQSFLPDNYMKKEKIRKLLEDWVDGIAKSCEAIGKEFDAGIIHKFRVSVKRARSFLLMYRMHTGQYDVVLSPRLIKLYHLAGEIRETQLEIEKCKGKRNLPVGYKPMLRKKLADRKDKWKDRYDDRVLSKLRRRLATYEYQRLPAFTLDRFVNERLEAIAILNAVGDISDDEIHTVRKYLKDITYNIEWAGKKWTQAYDLVRDLPIDDFNKLTTEIGEFNDERLARAHILSFMSAQKDNGGKPAASEFQEQAESRLLDKKKKIQIKIAKALSSI